MRSRTNTKSDIQLGKGSTSNAELDRLAEQYLGELKARKYSPQSIKKRRDNLRKFLLYLEGVGIERLQDVSLQTFEAFRLCLVDHEYSGPVIESDQRAVKLFFEFLETRGDIFENPALYMKIRKAPVNLGTVMSEREVNKLLSMPDTSTPWGLRDRAILEVLYSTGIRRGECHALSLHDVDLDRATIRVQGKNRKQRLLPIGKQAVKFLRLYIRDARPRLLPKIAAAPDALWLDRCRKRMGQNPIRHMVHTMAEAAGIKKTIDAHCMRRTCATHLLRNGAHPVVVAELLGHADLTSLAHYLRTTITDLKAAHGKSKPGR